MNSKSYKILVTSNFKKALKMMQKRNKDLDKLTNVVNILSSGKKLGYNFKDHQLVNYKSSYKYRECHIEPDWLLIYHIDELTKELLLVETGSHSDLF